MLQGNTLLLLMYILHIYIYIILNLFYIKLHNSLIVSSQPTVSWESPEL